METTFWCSGFANWSRQDGDLIIWVRILDLCAKIAKKNVCSFTHCRTNSKVSSCCWGDEIVGVLCGSSKEFWMSWFVFGGVFAVCDKESGMSDRKKQFKSPRVLETYFWGVSCSCSFFPVLCGDNRSTVRHRYKMNAWGLGGADQKQTRWIHLCSSHNWTSCWTGLAVHIWHTWTCGPCREVVKQCYSNINNATNALTKQWQLHLLTSSASTRLLALVSVFWAVVESISWRWILWGLSAKVNMKLTHLILVTVTLVSTMFLSCSCLAQRETNEEILRQLERILQQSLQVRYNLCFLLSCPRYRYIPFVLFVQQNIHFDF